MHHSGGGSVHFQAEAHALVAGAQLGQAGDVAHRTGQIEALVADLHAAGFYARQVQYFVQQPLQGDARAADDVDDLALMAVEVGAGQYVREADNPVQGRTDFVAHVGEKLALGAVCLLGLVARLGQGLGVALKICDVHQHHDHPAIGGAPLFDAHPAAIVLRVFVQRVGRVVLGHTLLQPLLLAANGGGVALALEGGLQDLPKGKTRLEVHGRHARCLGIGLVPEDQPVLSVAKSHSLGNGVDDFAQASRVQLAGKPFAGAEGG